MPYKSIEGLEHIDKVIEIDQSPIGRTPRSNPATYTKVFGDIRKIFSELPEAKIRGYKPGRFSFNVKGGRCEECQGGGGLHVLWDILLHYDGHPGYVPDWYPGMCLGFDLVIAAYFIWFYLDYRKEKTAS